MVMRRQWGRDENGFVISVVIFVMKRLREIMAARRITEILREIAVYFPAWEHSRKNVMMLGAACKMVCENTRK